MHSTSPSIRTRGAGAAGRAVWREMLLLAGVSVLTGCAVTFGLWAAFGPCPDRHAAHIGFFPLHASSR